MSLRHLDWIVFFLLAWTAAVRADDFQPTPKQAEDLAAHAASWDLVLQREHLKHLVGEWKQLTAMPDSATACYNRMLVVADAVVDRLVLATGYPRSPVMRWLEADIGLAPFFFPPGPGPVSGKGGFNLWTVLQPLLPILVYRVVDRVLD